MQRTGVNNIKVRQNELREKFERFGHNVKIAWKREVTPTMLTKLQKEEKLTRTRLERPLVDREKDGVCWTFSWISNSIIYLSILS